MIYEIATQAEFGQKSATLQCSSSRSPSYGSARIRATFGRLVDMPGVACKRAEWVITAFVAVVTLTTNCTSFFIGCDYDKRRLVLEMGDLALRRDSLHVYVALDERRGHGLIFRSPSKNDSRSLYWRVSGVRALEDFDHVLVKSDRGEKLLRLPVTKILPRSDIAGEETAWQAPGGVDCRPQQDCYQGPLLEGQPTFEDLWKTLGSKDLRIDLRSKGGVLFNAKPHVRVDNWYRPACS